MLQNCKVMVARTVQHAAYKMGREVEKVYNNEAIAAVSRH